MAPKPPTARNGPGIAGPVLDPNLERETGFEPATPSLEGWRSTAELFPRLIPWGPRHGPQTPNARQRPGQAGALLVATTMVGRGGFEPPKAFASRFTVCPLWPLGYLPESTGMYENSPETSENAGAGGRTRTPDPLLTRQLLYH